MWTFWQRLRKNRRKTAPAQQEDTSEGIWGDTQSLLSSIKGIQIRSKRQVNDIFAGAYESAFKGRGMEFEEVRDYSPGDDIRSIDWNVTARMQSPYIKTFREERQLTVMLMVDVTASAAFGSTHRLKSALIAEITAILAQAALRSQDKVGLLLFSHQIETYVPPKKGHAHIWRILKTLLAHKTTQSPSGQTTFLDGALTHLMRIQKRSAVVFVISDFLDLPDAATLRLAGRKHDLTAITVGDPREHTLPSLGILTLEDIETGEQKTIDTADIQVRQALAHASDKLRQKRTQCFNQAGVGQLEIQTHDSVANAMVAHFHKRPKRACKRAANIR